MSRILLLYIYYTMPRQSVNDAGVRITTNHWGITTSLVVIPQSNPLNFPRTGIQIYYIYYMKLNKLN